jgi:hypothetical protein
MNISLLHLNEDAIRCAAGYSEKIEIEIYYFLIWDATVATI